LQLIDENTTKPASLRYGCSRVCVNHLRHCGSSIAAQLKVWYEGLHAHNFLSIGDNYSIGSIYTRQLLEKVQASTLCQVIGHRSRVILNQELCELLIK